MKATTPKSPLFIAAIQLGLLFLAIYYTFIGGQTAQGIYDHSWRFVTLWVSTLLIGLWLGWRLFSRAKIPRTSLDFPLLLVLIAWMLATIFSINPIYSRESLVFFIIYLFFFYLAADLGRWPWMVELFFNAVITVSGLVWTLALWQLSRWSQDVTSIPPVLLQMGYEPATSLPRLSVLGNPNTMASYLALIIPITLYKFTHVRTVTSRILLGLWIVMVSGAVLLTQSRGGIIGFAIAGGGYLLVWTVQRLHLTGSVGGNSVIKARFGRWLLALAVVVGLGFLGGLILFQRGVQAGLDVRQQVGAGALKTLLRHPVFGSGPGTLGQALIQYQKPLDTIWADAHNLFLTLTAETGLIGGLGLLWLVIVAVRILWSTIRSVEPARWRMSSMACGAALVGFAAHNMVDSLFKFPLIMMLVAAWTGIWISAHLSAPTGGRRAAYWRYPVMVIAFVGLAVTTFLGGQGIQDVAAYNQAVVATGQGDWQAALGHLKVATQLAPGMPFYQRQTGIVAGYLSDREPAYRAEAITYYQAALEQVDQLAIDHANLGCLLWAAEQPLAARQEMNLAHHLQPGHLLYRLNLGHYLENEGAGEAAVAQYAQILAAHPDYGQASYWQQTGWRRTAFPHIVEAAAHMLTASNATEDSLKLVDLYLYAGDIEAAQQVTDSYLVQKSSDPYGRHLSHSKVFLALEELTEARKAAQEAVEARPATGEAYLLLSEIALRQDDLKAAVQNIDAALFLSPTPDVLYQAGQVAAASGDTTKAVQYYDQAFELSTHPVDLNLTRYATEVARRRPLPVSYLPCLQRIYPSQRLIALTEAEGRLLETDGDYLKAAQIYHRLLRLEPQAQAIEVRLEALCRERAEACDFRANK